MQKKVPSRPLFSRMENYNLMCHSQRGKNGLVLFSSQGPIKIARGRAKQTTTTTTTKKDRCTQCRV
jgi:hypothetical protein